MSGRSIQGHGGARKVDIQQRNLLTAKEAARYLRVSLLTLSKIEKEGGIIPFRTPGGHRRYNIEMLNQYLEQSRDNRRKGASLEQSPRAGVV
jgi:excisionase family DNA binding protein